jgi:hypothetical protein
LDCPVCRDLLKRKLGFHRYEDCFVIFCLFWLHLVWYISKRRPKYRM